MEVNLGDKPSLAAKRDTIHVAVIPAIIADDADAGDFVKIVDTDPLKVASCPKSEAIGIIDPFSAYVYKNDRVWILLLPGTVTSIRHHWVHTAFPEDDHDKESMAERFVRETAIACGISVKDLLEHAGKAAKDKSYYFNMGDNEGYSNVDWKLFWECYTQLTGIELDEWRGAPFSCSC